MAAKLRLGLLFALALCISGCWSAREIDRLAFIMAVGFDRSPTGEGYIVTFRVVDPGMTGSEGSGGESGGQEPSTISLAVEAGNPIEALDTFRLSVARRPFLSHLQGIFIGEELAREGIDEVVDFLERHPEIRRSVNLLVTKGSAAARVLIDATPTLRTGSGVVATGLLEQAPKAGSVQQVRFGDFAQWMGSEDREAFAPVIELVPIVPPSVGRLPSPAQAPGGGAGSEGEIAASAWQFQLSGVAVFRGSRLAGYLDRDETMALSLVRNRLQRGTLALDDHGFEGAVEIGNADASLRLGFGESRPEVALEIRVDARLVATAAPIQASRNVEVGRIERAVEAKLKELVEQMIARLQEWGTDALGIGREFHSKFPSAWGEAKGRWPDIFSAIHFEVSVRATLREAGSVAGR